MVIVRIWYPVGREFFNLQPAFFPGYISLFIIGILACRLNWLSGLPDRTGRLWFRVALLGILLWPAIVILGGALEGEVDTFLGGMHWQSLAFSAWEAFVGTGMILGLLVIFRKRFNRQGSLAGAMTGNTYTVYIIHAPIIVSLGYALRQVPFHPLLKFGLVSLAGVALCFLVSHYVVRRIPYTNRIL